MTIETSEAAQHYASYGWLVIPVQGKKPVGQEWQKRATSDPNEVAKLFAEAQHDGVGVLLGERSNLIDFDCDSDEAQSTIEKLFEGTDVEGPFYHSARGKHYLFNWTDKLPQGSIKIVIDGLEIRLGNGSLGCQSVFPPSGGRIWINDPSTYPTVDIPQIVIERINTRYAEINQPKPIAKHRVSDFPGNPGEGQLNVPRWLSKHNREIIGRTENADVTRWHIVCPGIERHTTANSFRDCCVTQTASGILGGCCFHSSCGMRDWPTLRDTIGALTYDDFHEPSATPGPRVDPFAKAVIEIPITGIPASVNIEPIEVGEPDDGAEESVATDVPRKRKESRLPQDVFSIGGIIGRLLEHNQKTSLGPMPELALGGAIALLSVVLGHKVRDFRNLRTNSYVINLAPSGSGKDDARKVNKNLLRQLNWSKLLAPTKIKSSAGMVSALVKQNPSLFQIDELSGVLRTMRDPDRNPHMADVLTVLLECWGEATGRYEPGAYADSSKNPTIDQPHLCLLGTSIANEFWGSLTKRNLSDGLVGRFLVFEHLGYPVDSDGSDVEAFDDKLLAEVASWLKFSSYTGGDLSNPSRSPLIVPHSDEAIDRYVSHRKAINARQGESDIKSALWRRCNEKAGKLSLLAACSRCPPISGGELKIEIDDVNWGIKVANWLTNNMLERSQFKTADSPHEQILNKILDTIQDWTRKEVIGQRIRTIRADERDKIIRYAIQDGLIETRIVGTSTKSSIEYRVANAFCP